MEFVADVFLVAGALGAGLYCFVLSRRLRRFNDLENGVGGAVAVLSAQVDDLTRTLETAQAAAGTSTESLEGLTGRAEDVARRLELLVAAMHDLPEPGEEAGSADRTAAGASPRSDPEEEQSPLGPVFRRHGAAAGSVAG